MKSTARKERQLIRGREEILDAAARVLARGRDTTMQEIAAEAGYTAASLYTYFDSKEQLIEGLAERLEQRFHSVFEEPMPAGLSLAQRLELLLERQRRIGERETDVFRAFVAHGPPGGRSPLEGFRCHLERLTRFFEEHPEREELCGVAPAEAALFFLGLCHAGFLEWMTMPAGQQVWRTKQIVSFFLRGLGGRS